MQCGDKTKKRLVIMWEMYPKDMWYKGVTQRCLIEILMPGKKHKS